ncbi:hypothetical protein DFJ73DRAFT_760268 [Zopfochytrium polystomum]|nr:hypothetical protein DFJ73DRAFT_760268 [Zopfochytrium polystomum]
MIRQFSESQNPACWMQKSHDWRSGRLVPHLEKWISYHYEFVNHCVNDTNCGSYEGQLYEQYVGKWQVLEVQSMTFNSLNSRLNDDRDDSFKTGTQFIQELEKIVARIRTKNSYKVDVDANASPPLVGLSADRLCVMHKDKHQHMESKCWSKHPEKIPIRFQAKGKGNSKFKGRISQGRVVNPVTGNYCTHCGKEHQPSQVCALLTKKMKGLTVKEKPVKEKPLSFGNRVEINGISWLKKCPPNVTLLPNQ